MTTPIIFNNTVLRDGHQSLAATRMKTEHMLPALEMLDSLGFGALETWGGATIDAGLRFLGEFPFDRLDAVKAGTPKTPHMMLLRGQNIVQYQHFADDIVEAFIHSSAKHGMDIFRIFDALNDMRNIGTAVKAAKAAGKHAQGVICYTSSPVHTVEKFLEQGVAIEEAGCDSICLKDMAGLIPPYKCYLIVKGLKERTKLPVVVHTHETAGLGAPTYLAAIDGGADSIDCSISPFANGTGQPDTVRMMSLLEGHPRYPDPDYDRDTLQQLREHFTGVYADLGKFTAHKNEVVDTDALTYQVPGGMLSNFRNQLKEQNMEDKFDEVFREIPVVREALGWIPLVTPTSQIVGVQAMLNVKFGRWKNFTPRAMDIALGFYGTTPAPVNREVQKLAAEKAGKEPIDCRPADLQEPGMEKLREALRAKDMPDNDEYCVIEAMFPQELEKYWKAKNAPPAPEPETIEVAPPAPATQAPPANLSTESTRHLRLTIDGLQHDVMVEVLDEA